MTVATQNRVSPAPTRVPALPTVTVRRRVRPRTTVDIDRMTRYRGGTYSHTVDRIVFVDGTSARTDLIRLNPGIDAYSLDFAGVAPTTPSEYRADTWTAVPNLRTRAHEAEVDWILRNSVPQLSPAEVSQRVRAAGSPLGVANLAEHEAIAATQAAIWHFTNGLELDTRALNEPIRLTYENDGVTVEFDGEPELGGYVVDLTAAGQVTLTLQKSTDGRSWSDVAASQVHTEPGVNSHRKVLGVGATLSASRYGRAGRGHRFYRVTVAGSAAIAEVRFWLSGAANYRNNERVVHLYNYLLDGARRARSAAVAPRLAADRATLRDGVVGPFRLSATDSAALTCANASIVDSAGLTQSDPVESGADFYLRPDAGTTSATVTVAVPGASSGHGGGVVTGVASDRVRNMFTPLALAVPTQLVAEFTVDWSR